MRSFSSCRYSSFWRSFNDSAISAHRAGRPNGYAACTIHRSWTACVRAGGSSVPTCSTRRASLRTAFSNQFAVSLPSEPGRLAIRISSASSRPDGGALPCIPHAVLSLFSRAGVCLSRSNIPSGPSLLARGVQHGHAVCPAWRDDPGIPYLEPVTDRCNSLTRRGQAHNLASYREHFSFSRNAYRSPPPRTHPPLQCCSPRCATCAGARCGVGYGYAVCTSASWAAESEERRADLFPADDTRDLLTGLSLLHSFDTSIAIAGARQGVPKEQREERVSARRLSASRCSQRAKPRASRLLAARSCYGLYSTQAAR